MVGEGFSKFCDLLVDFYSEFVLWKGAGILGGALGIGAKEASQIHHICTNKNCISAATGGPWTPRFEAIFEKAGMTLEDGLNKIPVAGHGGSHSERYHQAIFDRLVKRTNGLDGAA